MNKDKYIQPLTKIYTSFSEAKEDIKIYGNLVLFDDNKILSITNLAQGNRNLIVGEPGVGKTEILKKFKEHHDLQGEKTCLINLRASNPIQQIDDFIAESSTVNKVLLLDALDEVRSSIFPEVVQKIESISQQNPSLSIYLSSRWIFVSKYPAFFPEYRLIRILPFSNKQVRDYLIQAGNSEADVDALLVRIVQFSHGNAIVQIPRYLFLLEKFIKDKTIANVSSISRNELFEYFIYSKLDIEDKKLNTDTKAVIKRILEKLALTMEIYQSNTITKDQLLTFFDDIDSDLKLTVLSNITLDVLFANTILQECHHDLDSIEFENAEFQEYLAAKEITRFEEPHRVTFSFAADEDVGEILPSWFNTLTFLVDMIPEILEQLLEFSGLRGGFKVADDGLLAFLSRVNSSNVSVEFRKRIFMDVIKYHEESKQWIPGQLADALPGFFTTELEDSLKEKADEAEPKSGSDRFVPLGNIAYAVAYLLKAKIPLDKPYWREKLISYANDTNENGVLQRHALFGLQMLGDKTVIDELPDLMESPDNLVSQAFLRMCTDLNPDNEKSLDYAIKSVRRNDMHGRYGLFDVKEKSSIVKFLTAYIEDDLFRKEFLDDTSIFGEKDSVLVSNIATVLDNDIEELCKKAIVKSVETYAYRSSDKSAFVNGLIRLLKQKNPGFIPQLLKMINESDKGAHALYFSQDAFVQVLEKEDIPDYIDVMVEADEVRTAMNTLTRIKHSGRESSIEIYEAGRSKLSKEYTEWEAAQAKGADPVDTSRIDKMVGEFRTYLEPTPGQYMTNVFHYYNEHRDVLEPRLEEKDRKRLRELIEGSVLNQNPAKFGLTIQSMHEDSGGGSTKSYTSSEVTRIFGDALKVANKLGVNVKPYRQNIALFIPFAYDNELKEIFDTVKDFTSEELEPVIAIYKEKNTDLWRHQPESFNDLVQQYHLVDAVPVLKDFVKESQFRVFTRNESLEVAHSIVPDPAFLREIFELYKDSKKEEEKDIAYTANGLLITSHADDSAITWRLEEIKKRAVAYTMPRSGRVHSVGPLDNELRYDKPFAKPLSDLKYPGFEEKYLVLLDKAMDLWALGKEYQAYAEYMWKIVHSYFENLKEHRSYSPLKMLEERIVSLKEKDGSNWLASTMVQIRRSYLSYLGKPRNYSEAIRKYNEARKYSNKSILNSADLFRHLQDAIDTELRYWVEDEGAYSIIMAEKKFSGNYEYEKLIQKTIKTQIAYILMKRGFKVDLAREEQLLNDKRTDIIVRYGFVGPIILEIKLASHSDIRSSKIESTESYLSMNKYMLGYGASHGIFLIVDNTGKLHSSKAEKVFGKIPNVWASTVACFKLPGIKSKVAKKAPAPKKSTRKKGKS